MEVKYNKTAQSKILWAVAISGGRYRFRTCGVLKDEKVGALRPAGDGVCLVAAVIAV